MGRGHGGNSKLRCIEDSNGLVGPNMHHHAEAGTFRNYEGSLTPLLHFQSCKHYVLDDSYIKIRVLECA